MEAAYKPQVNGELDTQNFDKFEEVYIYGFLKQSLIFKLLFRMSDFEFGFMYHKILSKPCTWCQMEILIYAL